MMRPQLVARSVRLVGRRANSTQAAKEAVKDAAGTAKNAAADAAATSKSAVADAAATTKEAAADAASTVKSAAADAAASAKSAATDAAATAKSAAADATVVAKDAAGKAQDGAAAAADKAQQLFASGLASAKNVAGPVGDKVGSMLGSYRQPIVYNWQTFTSLVRQVYQAERLAPPLQLSQWAGAYANIWSAASSPAWWRNAAASGQWAKVAVAGVEAYGIYKIGEIIGRRHLVGYKAEHHHH